MSKAEFWEWLGKKYNILFEDNDDAILDECINHAIDSISDEDIHISFPSFPTKLIKDRPQEERDNYFKQLGAKWHKQTLKDKLR